MASKYRKYIICFILAAFVFLNEPFIQSELNFSHAQTKIEKSFQCELHPRSSERCLLNWSPNGKWLATSTKTLIKVDIWDMETQTLFRTLETHADVLSWNRQGDLLATLTHYEINIWDVEKGEKVNAVEFSNIFQDELERGVRDAWPDRFTSIDWDDNTSQIAVVTRNWVAVWQLSTNDLIPLDLPSDYNPRHTTPLSVAWSPFGDQLAVAFMDGLLTIYNGKSLKEDQTFRNRFYYLPYIVGQFLSWNSDGRYLSIALVTTFDPRHSFIQIYEVETQTFHLIESHSNPFNAVVWSPTGEYIASAGGDNFSGYSPDNAIRIWDAETHELVQEIEFAEPITSISWHPEGRQLAAVDLSGAVYILEIE